jgi:hypothetical protein
VKYWYTWKILKTLHWNQWMHISRCREQGQLFFCLFSKYCTFCIIFVGNFKVFLQHSSPSLLAWTRLWTQFIEIANCTCLIYYITVVLYSVFASSSVIFTFCHQLTPGNVKTVVSRHDPPSPQMCTLCLMFQC